MDNAPYFKENHDLWTEWRRDFHKHPELAYQEKRTSMLVAKRLKDMGATVHTGYGGTGVVGVLHRGDGPNIGLRADMDALPIHEMRQSPYKSTVDGVMHACGHDGHTTMLLAAAQYLAEAGQFQGTATFIFQPAEESMGGALKMLEDGAFDDHPVDEVYALHNWPGLPAGHFAGKAGFQMAGYDALDITLSGSGGHAAMPHIASDCIVASGHLIVALQSILSRAIDPQDPTVLSLTQIHGGDTWNVLPAEIKLAGCVRYFDDKTRDLLRAKTEQTIKAIETQFGISITIEYQEIYPVTINDSDKVQVALKAAAQIVGDDCVHRDLRASMASEDFAFMLQKKPGAYLWLGNGPVEERGSVHTPTYDFNDTIIPAGAAFFAQLVEQSQHNR